MSDINNMLRQTAQIARLVTDPEAPARIERHQQAVTRALQEAREGQRQENEGDSVGDSSKHFDPIALAREVWPEAEGFLPCTRGWTFRVGGGYASITTAGVVARDAQGSRFDAVSYMGRRTPPARAVPRPKTEEQPTEAGATVEACQKCRRPFDPTDTRIIDSHARYRDTPFCGECTDACHETEIADHWCAIDQWRQEQTALNIQKGNGS